ncbi:hypothetical protein O3G_MSEX011294 [Manduca sexta]|uniref:Uncharacterized protein n=1 Tax=Manduca sexta TaxID=7130 RepID=A0A921ZJM7_MANSE|nr:hypothetical protein O3G_MSEX011294 [Manduca sexta]
MLYVSATVNIRHIDNGNGILLLKEGQILKQDSYFSLACIYNITSLRLTSMKLMSLFVSTKAAEVSDFRELHNTYRDQIQYNLKLISKKFQFLTPQIRRKRGIINGLGSVVKAITGNLDNDDAIKFENDIVNLRNKINSIQTSQKRSLVIAENAIDEFSNQLHKLDENQKLLVETLTNLTRDSSSVKNHLHFLDIYVQIDFSLQIVLDRLMLLEDAMTFARLGTMHPSIIGTQNLMNELNKLHRTYAFRPVAEISASNIHIIEKAITVKAYSTAHSINFILEIPSVSPKIYDLIHLYSIPDKNNLTVVPKSKYLALGNDEYTYLESICNPLTDGTQLCKTLETKRTDNTEDCIVSLVQHKIANCTHAKMNLADSKIQKIRDSTWLIVLKEEQVIRTECNSKTEYNRAAGVVLISSTEDCKIYIMNTTLVSHTNTIVTNEVIPLPKQQIVPKETIRFELQLEDISLDNIHELINRANDISMNNDVDWPMIVATPSWTTLLLYILLIIAVIWKIYKWKSGTLSRKNTKSPEESKGSEDATGSSPCFRLKEGGVTTP